MKMTSFHKSFGHITATLLLIFITTTIARKSKHTCPIGFNLAYTKHKDDDPICYRRKGPERFEDKFVDCAGNLYTSTLYHKLNITETNIALWADYKSLYTAGPYIDWSHTAATGDVLPTSADVKYDTNLLDEELCVVIDPVTNFTATKCNEMHYRYCLVKPYHNKEGDMSDDGCEDLKGYWRFWSPRSTCLTAVTGVGGGTVRATWRQAKEMCAKRGSSLLGQGWRYANNPLFPTSISLPTYPLGIILSPDKTSVRFDTVYDDTEIPTAEWNFESTNVSSSGTTFGAIRDDFWYAVNASFMFYDVICEKSIQLKTVTMNVNVDQEGKLVLSINDTMDENDVYCFTDSSTYYPKKVKVKYDDDSNIFVLKPISDGYYWCTHINTRNYHTSESNKALFIREKQSLVNYYAIQLRLHSRRFDSLEKYYRYWQEKLEEFIFYNTRYIKIFGELELIDQTSEEVLREFKATHPDLKWKEKEVIYKIKVKRYVEGSAALLHVQLNPEMLPVSPGFWDDIEVEFMKPVYYCKGFDSVPMLPLGASTSSTGCRTYTCVGDFNEGVQWVTTSASGCFTTTVTLNTAYRSGSKTELSDVMPTALPVTDEDNLRQEELDSSSEEDLQHPQQITTTTEAANLTTQVSAETVVTVTTPAQEVITVTTPVEEVVTVTTPAEGVITVTTPEPVTESTTTTTTAPLSPEEQLDMVMIDLETLILNETAIITVENIGETFDQVDNVLERLEGSKIPGNFLHLLDQLGGRIDLNGSHTGAQVRGNLALLVADAEPETPVRGLRIAARENDMFTEAAFEILSEEVNSTHLTSNESEAVVHLPDSVASSTRRISFVVFRNDRAFQDTHGVYSVNSRVLSINVENLTQFDQGEVIDIHLSPIMEDPDRNMSRACAYWHFLDDDTGFWSQEGCTLIRSRQEGVLDTCRCDHLTHFAEVLVPRALFTERNENVLEILTIIGCCLSIFGLCMVGLTAVLFRSWRRDYSNKIWLQLCISIFILVLCFLIVVFAKFDEYDVPCMLLGVGLHYSVLASFCWMLVAAVLSYRRLVIVFTRDASHKLLRASAFSWGAPCAVVGILLSVDPHSYAGRFEEKTPSGAFCYPSGLGLWLAVYAPIALMLIANWVLFVLIVRSVFASRRIQRHGDSNEAVRCATVSCLLVFLFGLPWIFGLFAYNIVAAYLFTLTATYQGFVLFLFFVLGNKKTRDLWLNKLKIKQTRKVPVTSSTYTHRSTGVGVRGDPEGASSIEANSSKPRSLASPDNSRFS